MDTHNPTQWCLIATLAVLYSIYATGRFLADDQPGWWPVVNVVARYILSFALLYNLPAPSPHAVPITTSLVLAALVAPKALRHIAHRRRLQCTCHTPASGPPDIERIP